MKSLTLFLVTLIAFFNFGCTSTTGRVTNPNHPGPALGNAVGVTTGVVVGNAAGAVVGAGEGFASGFKKPFKTDHVTTRTWKTVSTSDGRTIQVPVETTTY